LKKSKRLVKLLKLVDRVLRL